MKSVVIMLHGDMSHGDSDYMHVLSREYTNRLSSIGLRNFIIISPLRRGFSDRSGNRSSGLKLTKDLYTDDVVRQSIEFVSAIKSKFPKASVTIVGHSGGAAIAAIIAGMEPRLVDRLVLVGSPWYIRLWRTGYRRNSRWPNSLSPHNFEAGTSPEQKFFIIAGKRDKFTPPALAIGQQNSLSRRGRSVELLILDDKHNALMRRTETIRLVAEAMRR